MQAVSTLSVSATVHLSASHNLNITDITKQLLNDSQLQNIRSLSQTVVCNIQESSHVHVTVLQ